MKNLILLILSMLFAQCTSGDDDLLSLTLTPYNGNQLRIDGYYYQIGYDGKTIFSPYFFYKNGILISPEGMGNSLEEMDSYIKKYYLDCQSYKKDKLDWGVFIVEGNIIKFGRWYPSERPLKAFIREGVILNDTTFQITKSYRSDSTEQRGKDEMYYFRSFSPKPDSTNVYIK